MEWQSTLDNAFHLFDRNLRTCKIKNLLDIGSGDGKATILIAKFFKLEMNNVFGLDHNEQFIFNTNRIFNAKYVNLEIDRLPFEEGMFDLVVGNQVLEHLKNYRRVIDNAIEVTKKGGFILLGIPNLAHLINRFYLLLGRQPMCIHLNGPHVRGITHYSFVKLLKSLTGAKLIDYTGALMYPFPLFFAKYLTRSFVGLSGYTSYLLKKT